MEELGWWRIKAGQVAMASGTPQMHAEMATRHGAIQSTFDRPEESGDVGLSTRSWYKLTGT